MNSIVRTVSGIIVSVVATGLGALAIAADVKTPSAATSQTDAVQRHQEMVQRRLDSAAARLEIKASQQSAWQAYAAAVKDLADVEGLPPKPATDADAATLARQRAERASAHARKLSAVADATAKLQGVLSTEQRDVLTELARNTGMRGGPGGAMMRHPMQDGAGMDGRRGGRHGGT
jgi:hypothetical protein